MAALFQCGLNTVVSKPEIMHFNDGGFDTSDVGVLILLCCFALLGKVPPQIGAQAMLWLFHSKVVCLAGP